MEAVWVFVAVIESMNHGQIVLSFRRILTGIFNPKRNQYISGTKSGIRDYEKVLNNFDHGIFILVLAIVVAVIALLKTFLTIIPHPHVTANGPQPMAHTESQRKIGSNLPW